MWFVLYLKIPCISNSNEKRTCNDQADHNRSIYCLILSDHKVLNIMYSSFFYQWNDLILYSCISQLLLISFNSYENLDCLFIFNVCNCYRSTLQLFFLWHTTFLFNCHHFILQQNLFYLNMFYSMQIKYCKWLFFYDWKFQKKKMYINK